MRHICLYGRIESYMERKRGLKWNIENIREGFESFFNEYGHYPTAHEIDRYQKLPSSRQIQRAFGGLLNLRTKLNLDIKDFTRGEYSSQRAYRINKRAYGVEKNVYNYLIETFGVEYVHREFFFSDDRRNRTDFYIYHKDGNFSVDVFFPNTLKVVNGCINSKLKTYGGLTIKYPIIFLMMNDEIDEIELQTLIGNKKKKLSENQMIMNFNQFKKYCSLKKRR